MKVIDDRYLEILYYIEKHPRELTYNDMLKLANKDDYLYLLDELKYLQNFAIDLCNIKYLVSIVLSPKCLNY